MKKRIHFIINSRKEKNITKLIRFLEEDSFWKITYECLLWKSLYKGHTIALTQKAIEDNTTAIIACGGDGTINEIARFLVHTQIFLGVIPLGSGNGLARHLKIPLKIKKALEVIKKQNKINIDVGSVNKHFFICNIGVSFDAQFITEYQNISFRGIFAYFKATLRAFKKYKKTKYFISTDNFKREVNPFLLMICNTNQFGYNFSLTQKTKITDGKFELIIFKSKSVFDLLKLLVALITSLKLSKKVLEIISISKIQIEKKGNEFLIQYDGETNRMLTNKLSIEIHSSALNVLVP